MDDDKTPTKIIVKLVFTNLTKKWWPIKDFQGKHLYRKTEQRVVNRIFLWWLLYRWSRKRRLDMLQNYENGHGWLYSNYPPWNYNIAAENGDGWKTSRRWRSLFWLVFNHHFCSSFACHLVGAAHLLIGISTQGHWTLHQPHHPNNCWQVHKACAEKHRHLVPLGIIGTIEVLGSQLHSILRCLLIPKVSSWLSPN